jgi:hypoxanthine phosphoribosyltransferase
VTELPKVLFTAEQINTRVQELGREITCDYARTKPVLVCVLRGAVVFLADLIRALHIPITVDFIAVASYDENTRSTGVVRLLKDLDDSIEGRDVLVVEDIIDSGRTLEYLLEMLRVRRPRTLKVVTLLDKPSRREMNLAADYVGFQISDVFVVGYGLDLGGEYRNLPYIGVLSS